MARNGVKLSGFEGLSANLKSLEKVSQQKAAVRQAMRKAAKPIVDDAIANAPEDQGDLKKSIKVGSTLNKSQRKQARAIRENGAVQQYIGSTDRKSHLLEFGTVSQNAQPYLRPAWDSGKDQYLKDLGRELEITIQKAIKRQAKRNASNGS